MDRFFLNMIKTLRKNQEVILYDNILEIPEGEKQSVVHFLQQEFERESLNHPFKPPIFNPESALWAAEYIYIATQLMLYRKNEESELEGLLPTVDFDNTPETILSVDLCFRFMPDILVKLKLIDSQDPLIQILEKELKKWHFSGINYVLELENNNFDIIFENDCVKQLYLNRIITYKNIALSKEDRFRKLIIAGFGIYGDVFWKEM